jgi:putative Mg2+ transporter-C (MgtC) family protein
MPEAELRAMVSGHGFSIANLNYRLSGEGTHLEYRMVIRTLDQKNVSTLSEALNRNPTVVDYRISPTGD